MTWTTGVPATMRVTSTVCGVGAAAGAQALKIIMPASKMNMGTVLRGCMVLNSFSSFLRFLLDRFSITSPGEETLKECLTLFVQVVKNRLTAEKSVEKA
jgi:hypothetical protein